MSLFRRLAIWRLRWHLRIGPAVSDQTIANGLDNLAWRFASAGSGDDWADLLALLPRAGTRHLILQAASQRVPDGWWDS